MLKIRWKNDFCHLNPICSTPIKNDLRPFLMSLKDLDFRHKFVIDNPETPLYGPMFTNFGLLYIRDANPWWFDHEFMVENSWWTITDWHHGLASRIVFSKTMRNLPMVDSASYTNTPQKIEYPGWFKQRLCASRWFAWFLLRRQSVKNSKPWLGKDFQMLGSQLDVLWEISENS